jgi:hypothetical protein
LPIISIPFDRGIDGTRFAVKARMRLLKTIFLPGTFLIVTAFLLTGCATSTTTAPPRTATEQLLLSTAADHALRSADLTVFTNRTVFLDTTYFDSYDPKYAIGTIRDALSRAGACLVETMTNSQIVVEARCGALSIDGAETLFGIPNMGLPIPLAGALQIPELAFYKSSRQRSTAKILLLAYATTSREHIYSTGALDGKSYDRHYKILFISWVRTDIPEKQKKERAAEHYRSWLPQYDIKNLPAMAPSMSGVPSTNAPPATSK